MTTKTIQIELKKISANEALSDETLCYSADLYVDGVRIGVVSNHGQGGADNFSPAKGFSWDDYKRAEERVAAELPPIPLDFDPGDGTTTMTASLEVVCAELVEDHQTAKRIARMVKTKAVFFQQGLPAEGARAPLATVSQKGADVARIVAYVRTKYPAAFILNGLTPSEQVAAYKRAA